jgi:hypothetical protein
VPVQGARVLCCRHLQAISLIATLDVSCVSAALRAALGISLYTLVVWLAGH